MTVVRRDRAQPGRLDVEADRGGVVEEYARAEAGGVGEAALPVLDLGGVDDDLAVLRDGRQHARRDRQRGDPHRSAVDARVPMPASRAGARARAMARNSESMAARPSGSPDEAIDREKTVCPDRESYDHLPVRV